MITGQDQSEVPNNLVCKVSCKKYCFSGHVLNSIIYVQIVSSPVMFSHKIQNIIQYHWPDGISVLVSMCIKVTQMSFQAYAYDL